MIAKHIGHVKDTETLSVGDVTRKALASCNGTSGLYIMSWYDTDQLIVVCNAPSLVIGITEDRTFTAIESSAFNRYTKTFIPMQDGKIGILHTAGHTLNLTRTCSKR